MLIFAVITVVLAAIVALKALEPRIMLVRVMVDLPNSRDATAGDS